MELEKNQVYHLYNRGNNKQSIFFKRENYLYFLRKTRKYIKPYFEILCYCLMPNHFHFLIFPKASFQSEKFSEDIRIMLSSYTKGINKQEDRTGSLFQQNTKAKKIDEGKVSYSALRCFHYIHQNPLKAGFVSKMEDWEFSSFRDYTGLRNGTLCDKKRASDLLDLPDEEAIFYQESYQSVDSRIVKEFY